ncbi:hypothetical protein GGR54DRAFT_74208 [Hypoxylon sp. NC1633]|nr:hypothetical protein GGR54DRAFT_74208 [Hypoxylon sp. NC1633]
MNTQASDAYFYSRKLTGRSDFPGWYTIIRASASILGIWDSIDPDRNPPKTTARSLGSELGASTANTSQISVTPSGSNTQAPLVIGSPTTYTSFPTLDEFRVQETARQQLAHTREGSDTLATSPDEETIMRKYELALDQYQVFALEKARRIAAHNKIFQLIRNTVPTSIIAPVLMAVQEAGAGMVLEILREIKKWWGPYPVTGL